MYQYPVNFDTISNRESWNQIVQIKDDDTGDLITLTDSLGNSLYNITLEISPANRQHASVGLNQPFPFYDCDGAPIITATLANYISLIDVGTFQIAIPRSVITTLSPRTYDVFLTLDSVSADDGRQILIGKLPVAFGGRNT